MPSKKTSRPIDVSAKKTYSWWTKTYVFINKTQIKSWQAIFIIAFISGIASALIWSVSIGWHSSSSAASIIPTGECVAIPAGGEFLQAVSVQIKCGKNVKTAFFQWDNQKAQAIKSVSRGQLYIITKFQARANQTLKVYGTAAANKKLITKFNNIYDFKTKGAVAGTIKTVLNPDFSTAIVAGNTEVNILSTKFFAANQAMKVQKMIVVKTDTQDSDASYVSITYATDAIGTMETKTTSFVGDFAQFTDLAIYVPKDGYSKDITYKIMTGEIGGGATSGDSIYLSLSPENFLATTIDGGNQINVFSESASGATNHVMYIRKGVPVITTMSSSYTGSQKIGGIDKLTEFSVTAVGGQVALKKIKFNINLNDGQYGLGYSDLTATDFRLFRNGIEVSSSEYRIFKNNAATSTKSNELDYTYGTGVIATSTDSFYLVFDQGVGNGGEEIISAGTNIIYTIGAVISAFEPAKDAITTMIAVSSDSSASSNYYLIPSNNYFVSLSGPLNENLIWSDMSALANHNSTIGVSSLDWIPGYLLKVN